LSVLSIKYYPDSVLEKKCEPVKEFNKDLEKLLEDMYETMLAADGVGIAAPQIGILKQIAIVDVEDDFGKIELINPVLISEQGSQINLEGCLSIPGKYGDVKRSFYIKVKARDRYGKAFILEAENYLAQAIQHEIDHLNGILFITKANKMYTEEELEGLDEE
jgi:peptide deformylase